MRQCIGIFFNWNISGCAFSEKKNYKFTDIFSIILELILRVFVFIEEGNFSADKSLNKLGVSVKDH